MEERVDAGANSATANGSGGGGGDSGSSYDCNICLELAQDPVVTHCGHLFCWPCLYRWLASRSSCTECPVCKSAVEEAKVIPIYGRGKGSTDPRTKGVDNIPNRPPGQRTDVPRQNSQGGGGGGPFHQMGFSFFTGPTTQFGNVTLGFGLFPFLFGFSATSSGFPDLGFGGGGGGGGGNGGGNGGGGNRGNGGGGGAAAVAGSGSGNTGVTGGATAAMRTQQEQERFLSKLLLFVGFFVLLCLCFF